MAAKGRTEKLALWMLVDIFQDIGINIMLADCMLQLQYTYNQDTHIP